MTLEVLSPRQYEALRCIYVHVQRYEQPPTVRELGELLGIRSTNAVADLLDRLERKGWIEREYIARRKSRLLRLTTEVRIAMGAAVPHAGRLFEELCELAAAAPTTPPASTLTPVLPP